MQHFVGNLMDKRRKLLGGCIPDRSVIFPPCERPFAGAILSEKLSSTLSDSTNLNRRSRYPLTSPFTSVRVGSSLPSVWLTSNTYTARKPISCCSDLRSSAALLVSMLVAISFWRDLR